MTGILFSDLVTIHISKLAALLAARPEPYTDGVTVSNHTVPSAAREVAIVLAGGRGDRDTIDTEYHAVNVYCQDEGDAADLTAMVRALITSQSGQTVRDGNPIVFTAVNVHPTPVETVDGYTRFRMIVELRRRGMQI